MESCSSQPPTVRDVRRLEEPDAKTRCGHPYCCCGRVGGAVCGGQGGGHSPKHAWVERPQGGWTVWQYGDVGKVAGAANDEGHVDLDVLAEGTSVKDLLM